MSCFQLETEWPGVQNVIGSGFGGSDLGYFLLVFFPVREEGWGDGESGYPVFIFEFAFDYAETPSTTTAVCERKIPSSFFLS